MTDQYQEDPNIAGVFVSTNTEHPIRYPTMTHQWKVKFSSADACIDATVLSEQAVSLTPPSLLMRKGQVTWSGLVLIFESDRTGLVNQSLVRMAELGLPISITIDMLDGFGEPTQRYELTTEMCFVRGDTLTYKEGAAVTVTAGFDVTALELWRSDRTTENHLGEVWHLVHKYCKSA